MENIELAQTGNGFLVALVLNVVDTLRFFPDYQKLSAVTNRDIYFVLLIVEYVDSLKDGNVLSIFDGNSVY